MAAGLTSGAHGPGTITIVALTGSAYFASVYRASHTMPKPTTSGVAVLVLEMRGRHFYSLTGVDYVHHLITDMGTAGVMVILSDVEPDQRKVLADTGILTEVGENNVTWRTPIIGEALGQAWSIVRRTLAAAPPDA